MRLQAHKVKIRKTYRNGNAVSVTITQVNNGLTLSTMTKTANAKRTIKTLGADNSINTKRVTNVKITTLSSGAKRVTVRLGTVVRTRHKGLTRIHSVGKDTLTIGLSLSNALQHLSGNTLITNGLVLKHMRLFLGAGRIIPSSYIWDVFMQVMTVDVHLRRLHA